MSRIADMQSFNTADGTCWGVEVQLPGASNVLIVFHHPDGQTARKDRYAWLNWHGPEASSVQKNLDRGAIRATLTETLLKQLFIRSMTLGSGRGPAFSAA